MNENINVLDANGNILHHIGPSIEWYKEYDESGREIKYSRVDGQIATTSYDEAGNSVTVWDPPLPETFDI